MTDYHHTLLGDYHQMTVPYIPLNVIGHDRELKVFKPRKNSIIDDVDYEIRTKRDETVEAIEIIDEPGIEYLPLKVSKVFPNVLSYYVANCPIKKVTSDSLEIKKLEVLKLINVGLTHLPYMHYQTAQKILYLDLSENSIESIGHLNINSLSNLKELSLAKNHLNQLDESDFENFEHLEVLNLAGNRLTNLLGDYFVNNNRLQSIDLSNNKLMTIKSDIFDNAEKLRTIKLAGNECIDRNYDGCDDAQEVCEAIKSDLMVKCGEKV